MRPIPYVDFTVELIYGIVLVSIFLLIYLKTKEVYDLTEHKGIGFFRMTFLYFAMAYSVRLVMQATRLAEIPFGKGLPLLIIGYLSTMALTYLAYSSMWKYITPSHVILTKVLALGVALGAWLTRNPFVLLGIQVVLIIIAISMSIRTHKKHTWTILYVLILVFWLINTIFLGPHHTPLPVSIVSHVLSLGTFIVIYRKVSKWTG